MEWLSSNIEKRQGEILCIIFNQKGDKLISSSSDKTIVVWQVNYERNQIEYSYTLEDKHRNNWIMSLSLNESETALVSCGQDGYILLWVKGANDQWQYKNCATADQYFNRICFINNQEFVIHYQKKGCVEILTTKDYQLKEKQKIKYTDTILESTHGFPIYYNKKKDIILQKADRYIYLIGRDQNGKYMVQAEPIDCKTRYNYGTMTEDGLHIVIWISGEIKEFRIYRVSYA